MSCALVAILAVAGGPLARTAAHGPHQVHLAEPSPSIPESTQERWEYLYRLFSDLCHLCPTVRQTETLQRAESIYDLLHGFHLQPPSPSDIARVNAEAEACYAHVCQEYPVVKLQWDGQELMTIGAVPIALARGIARHVVVELTLKNTTTVESPEQLSLRRKGQPPSAISPRATEWAGARLWIVPLVEDRLTATRMEFELIDATPQRVLGMWELPITVSEPAHISGRLVDDELGQSWPGRVRVECSDRILRHGEAFAHNPTLSEKPVVFRPAMWKLPFFYSDGRFEIDVPAGRTVVTVERGFETHPVTQTLDLQPGEHRSVEFRLRRFVDMKELNWISGDTHIHWARNSWDQNEEIDLLSLVQRAEDLRVANNLTLYQWRKPEEGGPFTKPDQFPMGAVRAHSDGDYHLQMAEEYRNDNHYGHINLLNISQLIRPLATGPGSGGPPEAFDYPLNRTAILEARRQGGVSIEAHNLGPFTCSDVPVNVALGLTDSLDQLEPEHYYRFLNSGFHIGLTNGSDHPARVAGCARAYVRVDGPFTYERWIEGLRKSRTFVTSGPLLFLKVNGRDIGDTLQVTRDEQLHVEAHVVSRAPVGTFEVVSNGEVLRSVCTADRQARIEFDLPADRSRWFVSRASRSTEYDCLAGPDIAHTSAMYVLVDGREVIRREAVEWWIENVRAHAERVRTLARFENGTQRDEALRHIAEGLSKYQALRSQADD
ncbi:MAG: CehA/McbA family metallohydrolase [Pirellulaceae bacterium]